MNASTGLPRIADPDVEGRSRPGRGPGRGGPPLPGSAVRRPAAHQPAWDVHPDLACIRAELEALPALVDHRDAAALRRALAAVSAGRALVLHVGECAERFSMADPQSVGRRAALYQDLATRLAEGTGREVVLVARMAGQHAKPRSGTVELLPDGRALPVYLGDAVNGLTPTPRSRRLDPWRLLTSYDRSRDTLEHLAARAGERPLFVSHEALLRDYEEPLTRGRDLRYAASGHLVWIGDRTRGVQDWHVAWAASLVNPVGVKLGTSASPDDAAALARILNPSRLPGRLTLIMRLGLARPDRLGELVRAVVRGGVPVVWQCDPMHGNTRRIEGAKFRLLPDLRAEISHFVRVLRASGASPGGLHLEVTPDEVAECHESVPPPSVLRAGSTAPCDPRLRPEQASAVIDHFVRELNRSSEPGR